jgi:hypothetical protein
MNCLDGACDTRRQLRSYFPICPFNNIPFQDAVEGAQTSIYLAVSEEVEGVSGKYFENCKVK